MLQWCSGRKCCDPWHHRASWHREEIMQPPCTHPFRLLLIAGAAIMVAAQPGLAQTGGSPATSGRTMASDIDTQSGFRLPLRPREELDDAGKRIYDRAVTPGASLVGLQGPAGVQLYSPKAAEHLSTLNRYLRFQAGISPRIREIAISSRHARWTASSSGWRTSRKP